MTEGAHGETEPVPAGEESAGGGENVELAAGLQRVLLVSSRILRSHTASEEVSAPQFSVLAYLQRTGESTPGALAEFDHVSPPVMTRILGRLEHAGLVRRDAHPGDGRQVRVTLTDRGQQLVLAGRERRHAWLRSRIEEATPAQQAALRDASRVLQEILIPPRD
ncbi:transcriptional regulator [Brachybacterium faecium DSM 4810]|uniref:Transcriptional regulator n=1 Tax=Brachybacterium faecium (strain ATCC 43885 / DSM 4810 / JCM 11609 / LMG 19847 / NBRC 14762 / NCIMB 9860 / 6-10) TaxID=446465 RepID=C7MC85_BRAFD|nr:MarR family transcriptional regulator [Brachybacterium faecium]ACU85192.1 transcriptional regulator [Brachybacterium faecium DSM 4810]